MVVPLNSHHGRWTGERIILQLQVHQRSHLAQLGRQLSDLVATHVQRDQLQVREFSGNVDQLIVPQRNRAQLSQFHHTVGQLSDLIAGRVQLCQLVHSAEFVRQLNQSVVGHQQDLQWQQA